MRLNLRSLLESFVPPSVLQWGTLQIELSKLEISEAELEADLCYGRDDDADEGAAPDPKATGGDGPTRVMHARLG